MNDRPNVMFIMTDQLSASVLPLYGGTGVPTPNLESLAKRGVTFTNMISTCPVCTPFRSMWLTGKYPQSTGHVVNGIQTRYDEIGWGDVFAHAGYDTGYVGKWHLCEEKTVHVPNGRARLGFEWWRGYNLHATFFEGLYDYGDTGETRHWKGFETDALTEMAFEYLDTGRNPEKPFCLMLNPHQPHFGTGLTPDKMAPDEYYDRLPDELPRPEIMDEETFKRFENEYRNYYALILTIDDMIATVVDGLDKRGLLDTTILVFTSDHGTQLGTHPVENTHPFWTKKWHWETNVRVPLIVHWPNAFADGRTCDALTAPVDLLPTMCGLCEIPVPSCIEGKDLSRAWLGEADAPEQDAVYMMNFAYRFLYCEDGWEWRGIRTKTHTYARYLDGKRYLFENDGDPWQQANLVEQDHGLAAECERKLQALMDERNDSLRPGSSFADWLDDQRRVVRNVYGPLGDPEAEPDWSLLNGS